MSSSKTPRWVVIAILVALGVIVVAVWPTGEGDAPQGEEASEPADAAKPTSGEDGEAKLATRRVIEGCDPVSEAKKYQPFVDQRALVTLNWNDMGERAAKLKIPVYVKSIDEGTVAISVLEIPMREQYLTIWGNSGHIKHADDGTFLVDPCSSGVESWPTTDD